MAGDLNSRTSDCFDYIDNDTLHADLLPVVGVNIEPEYSKRMSLLLGCFEGL